MTSISKQAKISARKLIKENFILCFITALLFTLPMIIYLFIPIESTAGMSTVIQASSAPLVLLGCKLYFNQSIGEKMSLSLFFKGYSEQNILNLGFSTVWKTVIVLLKCILLPMVVFIALLFVLPYLPISYSITELYIAVFTFLLFAPFIVLSFAETYCIYMAAIACMFNNKDKHSLKEYTNIFNKKKFKVLLFSIEPVLFFIIILFLGFFISTFSIIITLPMGMMYCVACFTFYAKYTLDENMQNGTIQADISNTSENIHSDEQKYSGVDKDLL